MNFFTNRLILKNIVYEKTSQFENRYLTESYFNCHVLKNYIIFKALGELLEI